MTEMAAEIARLQAENKTMRLRGAVKATKGKDMRITENGNIALYDVPGQPEGMPLVLSSDAVSYLLDRIGYIQDFRDGYAELFDL